MIFNKYTVLKFTDLIYANRQIPINNPIFQLKEASTVNFSMPLENNNLDRLNFGYIKANSLNVIQAFSYKHNLNTVLFLKMKNAKKL